MLENGDLIFVREDTEMGQAIQTSTGNYSHVAIFLDVEFREHIHCPHWFYAANTRDLSQ